MKEFLMNVDVRTFSIFSVSPMFLLMMCALLIILFEIRNCISLKEKLNTDFLYKTVGLFSCLILFSGLIYPNSSIRGTLVNFYFKDFEVSLNESSYFSLRNGNSLSFFEVYKIKKKNEVKQNISSFEKVHNGLEILKSKEIIVKLEDDKEILFVTTCKGYSINQCVEKVKELLKNDSYALNLNSNKEIKL